MTRKDCPRRCASAAAQAIADLLASVPSAATTTICVLTLVLLQALPAASSLSMQPGRATSHGYACRIGPEVSNGRARRQRPWVDENRMRKGGFSGGSRHRVVLGPDSSAPRATTCGYHDGTGIRCGS